MKVPQVSRVRKQDRQHTQTVPAGWLLETMPVSPVRSPPQPGANSLVLSLYPHRRPLDQTDRATDFNLDPHSKKFVLKRGKKEGKSLAGLRPNRQIFGMFIGSSAVPTDGKAKLCSPLPHLRHMEKKNVHYNYMHSSFSSMRSYECLRLPLLEAKSSF